MNGSHGVHLAITVLHFLQQIVHTLRPQTVAIVWQPESQMLATLVAQGLQNTSANSRPSWVYLKLVNNVTHCNQTHALRILVVKKQGLCEFLNSTRKDMYALGTQTIILFDDLNKIDNEIARKVCLSMTNGFLLHNSNSTSLYGWNNHLHCVSNPIEITPMHDVFNLSTRTGQIFRNQLRRMVGTFHVNVEVRPPKTFFNLAAFDPNVLQGYEVNISILIAEQFGCITSIAQPPTPLQKVTVQRAKRFETF